MGSEQQARETIDRLLTQAGWVVADYKDADIPASRGVAREFVLAGGFGLADYLQYHERLDADSQRLVSLRKIYWPA